MSIYIWIFGFKSPNQSFPLDGAESLNFAKIFGPNNRRVLQYIHWYMYTTLVCVVTAAEMNQPPPPPSYVAPGQGQPPPPRKYLLFDYHRYIRYTHEELWLFCIICKCDYILKKEGQSLGDLLLDDHIISQAKMNITYRNCILFEG